MASSVCCFEGVNRDLVALASHTYSPLIQQRADRIQKQSQQQEIQSIAKTQSDTEDWGLLEQEIIF